MSEKKRHTGKIFWGLFLVLAAAFLVVSKLGFMEGIGVVTILFAIFWVAILLEGVVKRSFGRVLFSLAFLCILFDEQLHIETITPWTVLIAALLGTIGLNLIFRRKRRWHRKNEWKEYTGGNPAGEDILNGNRIYFRTSFGSAVKYINSDNLEFASLECSFGAMKVYFDNASIPSGNATVDLDISFGGVELYVPKHWNVVNHTDASFGGVDEKNRCTTTGSPVLTLTGDVNFSGVTIIYV